MKIRNLILAGLILITAGTRIAAAQPSFGKKLAKTLELVDTSAIRDRIIYLSDDRLLGRKPGTRGFQMAVDYVVAQLKSMSVEPRGDDGYLQQVTIRTARLDTTGSSFALNGKTLRHGHDIVLFPNMNKPAVQSAGELVWAGYGITAQHLGHDDYKDLDVKGKVVVVRDGTPSNFPASEMAHFNSIANKGDLAARYGAVGILLVEDNHTEFNQAANNAFKGLMGYVNRDGTVGSGRMSVHPQLNFTGVLPVSILRTLLLQDATSPELLMKPRHLGQSAKIETKTLYRDLVSFNVIGLIRGTDAKLRDEYVVHTAHLDHIGITRPIRGDSINNGAHDNASGTACALEIAKLYKNNPPRRSVLVAFVTAEEMGLLGSRYFATNPPVPKEKIVADVNTDMPTLLAPLLSIEPLGAKHSTLMNEVNRAAKYLNLEVHEDHMPEQVRFVRSDQYSFIRQGFPALHIKYGLKTNDPKVDLRKVIDEWTEAHYHKPSDEFSDKAFDFSAAATYVRLNFLIGWQVANTTQRPQWVKGDFFGETFGKQQ